jgi:hypothetical protein
MKKVNTKKNYDTASARKKSALAVLRGKGSDREYAKSVLMQAGIFDKNWKLTESYR